MHTLIQPISVMTGHGWKRPALSGLYPLPLAALSYNMVVYGWCTVTQGFKYGTMVYAYIPAPIQ